MSELAPGEHMFLRLDPARVHVWERDKSDEAR
jgi:hypothetical protein